MQREKERKELEDNIPKLPRTADASKRSVSLSENAREKEKRFLRKEKEPSKAKL